MKKVLIVDDDSTLLEAIQIAIEMDGNHAYVVSDGCKVLESAKATKPDLILLDVLLSGYDGRDIAKQLKEDPEVKNIPLVMLSASTSIEDIVAEVGADGFLAKPFEIEELWAIVTEFSNKTSNRE